MSSVQSRAAGNRELVDRLEQFFKRYYDDEIKELVKLYPNDRSSLVVDWYDLYRYDHDIADDFLTNPDKLLEYGEEALRNYDLPVDIDFQPDMRVSNLNETDVHRPSELRKKHAGKYIGISGELARITEPDEVVEEAAFECQRCGTMTYIPQTTGDFQEPHECQGCERSGPFDINFRESEFENYAKLRIQTPPDKSGNMTQDNIDGYATGDIIEFGHEDFGLVARAGDNVTAYGVIERVQKSNGNEKTPLFERRFRVEAIEFEDDDDDVDIEQHRDDFEALADRDDAVDLFAESLVPSLYATPEWEAALELGVAYLFAAPRIDVPGGPTYRGDIHFLLITDYSMGKSTFNSAIADYSPHVIKESVTGLSSDVGLLAAAVEDDFGDGQWTIEPGVLVRGNGGHVILDEIDKTNAELSRMNDALEGEQMIDINKAGQRVSYESRVGLLATGNPDDSRFDEYDAVADQLGIDQSLLSRFDGIVTMKDSPDKEQDREIAETIGKGYSEGQAIEYGDQDEFDFLDRVVDPDVGRAWVAYARENVFPTIRDEHIEMIKDWYADEVRQLNHTFANDEGEGSDMPVPATARVVEATIRFSVAFARAHLRDTVHENDVERAMNLSKVLVGQTFDGEMFSPHEAREPHDQIEPKIKSVLQESESALEADEIASELNRQPTRTKSALDSIAEKGRVRREDGGWVWQG